MKGPRRPPPPPPPPPLPPLHGTNKESNKSKKRQRQAPAALARRQNPTSSAPQRPQQQLHEKVVIIDLDEPPVYEASNPQEFKEIVQRLTGMSPGEARAKEVPAAASPAPKAVQSSASDSSDAELEEMMKWIMEEDHSKFVIGQSSSGILPLTPESLAPKAAQSSASDSHAALEKNQWIREEDIPEFEIGLSSSCILSPTPATLPHISSQDCFFNQSDKKAVLQRNSGRFPPPSLSQIAPQDSFFSGFDTNALLKGNFDQLPRPPQRQEPPTPPQIARCYPLPVIPPANNSLPSIAPWLSSWSPVTAQYKLPQQIQRPSSVPWNRSSSTSMTTETYNSSLEIQQTSAPKNLAGSMWPLSEDEVDRILASFEQIQMPPSVPSNSSLSPINEHSNLPQGLSVPYRSSSMPTTTSPEIQQSSKPDNLAGSMWPVTEEEVERFLASSEQTQGPPSVLSNSSNSPQGLKVPHRSSSTQTYNNSSPEIQQTSVPHNLETTEDELDRMLASSDFELQDPFPRLPTP